MLLRLIALLAVPVLLATAVSAQTSGRNMEKESMIWEQLKVIAPGSVDDFKAGTTAMDTGDYDQAVKRYDAVLRKAPDFDPAIRRLGSSMVLQGKVKEGLDLLEQAVEKNRSADNLYALAYFLAYPGENKQGTRDQKWRAYSLIMETEELPKAGDDVDYQLFLAQLALEFQQVDIFRRATQKLVATHQELMGTHYFNAILAANDENWVTAENEIRKAESMGLSHEVVQEFLDSGVHARASVWRYSLYGAGLVALWITGLLLLFLLGKLMSKKTVRSIEDADPNLVATPSDLALRKWYRSLINIGGVYYYLSMPFVILLVIGLAAAVTYGSFAVGRLPIKLLLILWAGALLTVYKMIRSLFLKVEREDPGRCLNHDEAPGLWDLTRQVAETVKTRPVDEIRVTLGTDLAVYERGSWRERSKDQARRILILGVGVLNGFNPNAFRAVLAHEYGHFTHRDTAGGDVALRVNDDMIKFARAMILSRQNVWWNLGFQFLRIYHFIFRRISHGATRLQELLADRMAASKYGAQAFEEGLKHVIRRDVEFGMVAKREINESALAQRVLQNLYELPVAPTDPDIEVETRKIFERETSEDDTHPSPNDRFRLTRKIVSQTESSISGTVWDLFADKDGLTREMTALVQQNLR